jgi:hypothetical protein
MEYVEGETLGNLIKRSGRLEVKLAPDTRPYRSNNLKVSRSR